MPLIESISRWASDTAINISTKDQKHLGASLGSRSRGIREREGRGLGWASGVACRIRCS